jgi:hypothetical protein
MSQRTAFFCDLCGAVIGKEKPPPAIQIAEELIISVVKTNGGSGLEEAHACTRCSEAITKTCRGLSEKNKECSDQ